VEASDWLVPLRVDQPLRSLDLSGSVWPRSANTDLISDLL
jgi:hypothetical protein